VLLLFSCAGEKSYKDNKSVAAVCKLANRATVQSWNSHDPVQIQLQCIEGYLVRKDNTTATPDCSGATLEDQDKKYFEVFKDGTCPKENVIATCKTSTGSIYLYDSDLNKDIEFFKKYCEHFSGMSI
jgi:hypothetical protein